MKITIENAEVKIDVNEFADRFSELTDKQQVEILTELLESASETAISKALTKAIVESFC